MLVKSREAALCGIKIFNDPLVSFKSETYIVLMIIAWTYLLHAYYREKGIDYCYFDKRNLRKIYTKTKFGEKRKWELEKCLDDVNCPLDKATTNNLKFLIGLRHEIEHQMTSSLDNFLSGRYQACAMNFNYYIKKLFGQKYTLDKTFAFSIQFAEFSEEQLNKVDKILLPNHLNKYIQSFDNTLTETDYNDVRFSYRLLFVRKLVSKIGQSDKVIEFIDPNSELAKNISKEFIIIKDSEKENIAPSLLYLRLKKPVLNVLVCIIIRSFGKKTMLNILFGTMGLPLKTIGIGMNPG